MNCYLGDVFVRAHISRYVRLLAVITDHLLLVQTSMDSHVSLVVQKLGITALHLLLRHAIAVHC